MQESAKVYMTTAYQGTSEVWADVENELMAIG